MKKSLYEIQIEQCLDNIENNIEQFIAQLNLNTLEDLLHVYDDHELCVTDHLGNYLDDIPLNENVDRIQRIMRSIHMKSHSYDIHMHRKLAIKMPSSIKKLSQRANKAALWSVKHHIDRNYNKLAPMERAAIDRIVKNRSRMISSISKQIVPHIRGVESHRLAKYMVK